MINKIGQIFSALLSLIGLAISIWGVIEMIFILVVVGFLIAVISFVAIIWGQRAKRPAVVPVVAESTEETLESP